MSELPIKEPTATTCTTITALQ